jgi:hypothetical protein
VLFIRRDNAASLRAHEKMGMREVAGFAHGGAEMAVLASSGDRDGSGAVRPGGCAPEWFSRTLAMGARNGRP